MIIAHISDFHIQANGRLLKNLVDSEAALAAAVEHVWKLKPRPDVVLATGDLVNRARRRNYRIVRGLLDALRAPYLVVPGNNDDRPRMLDVFGPTGGLPADGAFLHYTVEDHPLRLIGLDTLDTESAAGRMCRKRLTWLEARLAEQPTRPTFLFMHHPPFATGIDCIDDYPFVGAETMAGIVGRHPNIVGIACGHVHRQIHARWAGTMVSVAPSTAFQTRLDLRPGAAGKNLLEPPAVVVYRWDGKSGVSVHNTFVGDFD